MDSTDYSNGKLILSTQTCAHVSNNNSHTKYVSASRDASTKHTTTQPTTLLKEKKETGSSTHQITQNGGRHTFDEKVEEQEVDVEVAETKPPLPQLISIILINETKGNHKENNAHLMQLSSMLDEREEDPDTTDNNEFFNLRSCTSFVAWLIGIGFCIYANFFLLCQSASEEERLSLKGWPTKYWLAPLTYSVNVGVTLLSIRKILKENSTILLAYRLSNRWEIFQCCIVILFLLLPVLAIFQFASEFQSDIKQIERNHTAMGTERLIIANDWLYSMYAVISYAISDGLFRIFDAVKRIAREKTVMACLPGHKQKRLNILSITCFLLKPLFDTTNPRRQVTYWLTVPYCLMARGAAAVIGFMALWSSRKHSLATIIATIALLIFPHLTLSNSFGSLVLDCMKLFKDNPWGTLFTSIFATLSLSGAFFGATATLEIYMEIPEWAINVVAALELLPIIPTNVCAINGLSSAIWEGISSALSICRSKIRSLSKSRNSSTTSAEESLLDSLKDDTPGPLTVSSIFKKHGDMILEIIKSPDAITHI